METEEYAGKMMSFLFISNIMYFCKKKSPILVGLRDVLIFSFLLCPMSHRDLIVHISI